MQHTTTDLLTRIESLEDELGRLKSLAAQQSPAAGSPVTRDDPAPGEPSTSRRDWLRFGGVAALGAAAAAMTTSPAEAADGGPVLIGNANAGTSNTTLAATGAWGFWTTSNSS